MILLAGLSLGLLCGEVFGALPRGAIPLGSTIPLTGSQYIPTTYQRNSSGVKGLLLSNVQGKGTSPRLHLMVINQTSCLLSVVPAINENGASVIPTTPSFNALYVVSSGIGTWDQISLFDNLFVRSEGGSSCAAGSVQTSAW